MKTIITIALVLLSPLLFAQSAEEEAIKETLRAETTAWMNRDYDAWASHWDQEGSVSMLVTNLGMGSNDWEEMSQTIKQEMENNSKPIEATLENSDYSFSVDGDHAFVTYKQMMKTEDGVDKSYQIRNLRKVDGQWKVAAMIHSPLQHEPNEANVKAHLRSAVAMMEQMERYDDGIELAQTFTEIFPESSEGYWNMGAMYLEKEDKENAMKYLDKAMSIEPDNSQLKELYEKAEAL